MRRSTSLLATAILIPALMFTCNIGALAEGSETDRAGPVNAAEDRNVQTYTQDGRAEQDISKPQQTIPLQQGDTDGQLNGGGEGGASSALLDPGASALSDADPVSISIVSDKAEYYRGETVKLTVTVTNSGSKNYTSVSVSCDRWQSDGTVKSEVIKSNQTVSKNSSKQFTASTAVPEGVEGDVVFHASASGNYSGSSKKVSAETSVRVNRLGIAITSIAPSSLDVYSGKSAGFDVTVENTGNADLTGLALSDSMNSQYQNTAAVTISPGDTLTVHGILSVPTGTGGGSGTNTITATAFHNGRSTSDSEGFPVNVLLECDITVNKTASLIDSENRIAEVTLTVSGTPPARPVDAVLVIDRSASMAGTPLAKAKEAAKAFIDESAHLNPNNKVALVSYIGVGEPLEGLTALSVQNVAALKSRIDTIAADSGYNQNSGTNTMAGIQNAMDYLSGGSEQVKAIVLLSDGLPNRPTPSSTSPQKAIDKAGEAKAQGISVYSVGLFSRITNPTEKTQAINTLTACAETGCYYDAADPSYLTSIFKKIAVRISYIAQGAVITDTVSDDVKNNFTVYDFNASQGDVQYDGEKGVITWSPGTVGGDGATLTYKVRADEDYVGKNGMHTNKSALMDYTDVNGTGRSERFPDPVVDIPFRGKLTITKILKDRDGNRIAEPDREFAINVKGSLSGGGSVEWNCFLRASDINGASQLFKRLKAGTYTITEPYLPMGYRGQEAVTVTLGFGNPEDRVTVENRRVGNGYFTDDDLADNLIDTSGVTSVAARGGAPYAESGMRKIVDAIIPDRKAMWETEA